MQDRYYASDVNIDALSNRDNATCKPEPTFAQRCKECKAIPLSEFVAEWMRQLELRFKKTNDNSESID